MKTIKTIDLNFKEWFGKVNGNSYCAGIITINYGMKTERLISVPFTYGYDDYYIQASVKKLREQGVIPKEAHFSQYCNDNNIIVRKSIQRECKKRELMQFC